VIYRNVGLITIANISRSLEGTNDDRNRDNLSPYPHCLDGYCLSDPSPKYWSVRYTMPVLPGVDQRERRRLQVLWARCPTKAMDMGKGVLEGRGGGVAIKTPSPSGSLGVTRSPNVSQTPHGAFTYCAAGTDYLSGVGVIISHHVDTSWSLAFASPSCAARKLDEAATAAHCWASGSHHISRQTRRFKATVKKEKAPGLDATTGGFSLRFASRTGGRGEGDSPADICAAYGEWPKRLPPSQVRLVWPSCVS
jgi:hypothetical protein